jgi:hypothetical protein
MNARRRRVPVLLVALTGLLAAGAAGLAVATDRPSPADRLVQAADATLGASGFTVDEVLVPSPWSFPPPPRFRRLARAVYEAPDRLLVAYDLPAVGTVGPRTEVATVAGPMVSWSPPSAGGGPGFTGLAAPFLDPLDAMADATDVSGEGRLLHFDLPSLTLGGVWWTGWTGYAPLADASRFVAGAARTFRHVRGTAVLRGGGIGTLMLDLPGSGDRSLVLDYGRPGDAPAVPSPSG